MKKLIALPFLWIALAQAQQPIREFPLDSTSAPANPSRVIVKFRVGTSFLPGSGASHALGSSVYVVGNPPGLSVAESLRRYQSNPNVIYAEPDFLRHTTATPTDPMWNQQWDMVKINAPGAWNTQTNASDVIVAVIDTGVDFTHPDLQGNLWTNPADGSHGFTCMNGVCAAGGQDDYGHGTHVAGTIGAATNNGAGIAGINWRTQILACKFLSSSGSGSDSDAILCFNKLVALKQQGFNIRVSSNSWGGGAYSQSLKDSMAAAEAAGILNVCAAGNSGLNADMSPMYPGAYDNRGIVSVLASDQNDFGASFTNYGLSNVDIAAPGVSTLSTVPTGTCSLCDPTGYKLLSGTSMATPHVSAVAAAMFHLNPALTANQARDVLLDPASYDALSDYRATMTSTGGRLNFQKVIANPALMSPKPLNNFPTVTGVSNVTVNGGDMVNLSASASDADNDPLRTAWSSTSLSSVGLFGWMANTLFPAPSGNSVSFQAPNVSRTAMGTYAVSVADGRGGGAGAVAYATIQPGSAGLPPSGSLSVSPTSGPVGTTVTVNFPVTDPDGGSTGWDLWQTGPGGFGRCCLTTSSYNVPLNSAGVYRITTQAIDRSLNFSSRQSTVVRIGGATGTPPIANATFDKLSGPAPLTVNVDMTGSSDPDGTISNYITICTWGTSGSAYSGVRSACTYDTPGTYWMMLQVIDNEGLMDVYNAYIVVTPPSSGGGTKTPATVTLSNMTQTYTGSPLTPTATTNPPGLNIVWTNAPQANAGAYTVTATINDPNYQGSASGTFTINKASASVALGNLNQIYTGSALSPTAATTPSGLTIAWTNAPQTNPGNYAVTATVNNPNYQGSANGTFTIIPASVGTPPTVAVTNPVGGSVVVKSSVNIQAAVTAGTNPVARVDFLVNGVVACSDSVAPYSCSWSVPGAAGKTYQILARAYDTAGLTGDSAVVSVKSSR